MNNNVSWFKQDIKDFRIIKTRNESGELAEKVNAIRGYLTYPMWGDNKNFNEVDKGLKDVVENVLYENPVDIDELSNKIFEAIRDVHDIDKAKLSLNYIFCSILGKSEDRVSIKDAVNLCCGLAKKIAEGREYKPEDIFGELGESTKFAFSQFSEKNYPVNPLQTWDNMVKEGFGQEKNLETPSVVPDAEGLTATRIFEQEQNLNQQSNSILRRFINSLKSFLKSISNFFAGIGNKLKNIFRRNRAYEILENGENQNGEIIPETENKEEAFEKIEKKGELRRTKSYTNLDVQSAEQEDKSKITRTFSSDDLQKRAYELNGATPKKTANSKQRGK